MKIVELFLSFCLCFLSVGAQETALVKRGAVRYGIGVEGKMHYLLLGTGNVDTVEFRTDGYAGPALYRDGMNLPLLPDRKGLRYVGEQGGLRYALKYRTDGKGMELEVHCKNVSGKDLDSLQFSLRLGINTEMDAYPHWRKVFFPTLLRCEKTHFWGYLMNPEGRLLVLTSPDAVASWHLHYNNDKELHSFGHGHRIYTLSLDLLNPPPLPARHPVLQGLKVGEERRWRIYLDKADVLSEVYGVVHNRTGAPLGSTEYYTVTPGDSVRLTCLSKQGLDVYVVTPDGRNLPVWGEKLSSGKYCFAFCPLEPGIYTCFLADRGKTSEMKIACRAACYSDYIKAARQAALRYPQKPSTHTESWYGFFSAYIARYYFPDRALDEDVENMFWRTYPLMYDTLTNLPLHTAHRIQNHALMASLFACRYRATGNLRDLERAVDLVDFIISTQHEDGSYRSGKTHYTSVIYVAKALMEVMEQERILAVCDSLWSGRYSRHYASVKRAIDDLALHLDDIQTEGEMTFEDGMISCSYTQISQFALLQPEGSLERTYYTEVAEKFLNMHRCLSQLLVPDTRMQGGSLRFWEAQYDILSFPNMINSPHGWSAWRIYGLRNLYLLTGKYDYLRQMVNAIGSCIQLLNPRTAELHWAFICDPYIPAAIFVPDEARLGKGKYVRRVIGEQYMPMISDWYHAPEGKSVTGYWGYDGGCCDNDVHEIFKCLGEILLTSAYLYEMPDGTLQSVNCKVYREGKVLFVVPAEECVRAVHVNLTEPCTVKVQCSGNTICRKLRFGWVQ